MRSFVQRYHYWVYIDVLHPDLFLCNWYRRGSPPRFDDQEDDDSDDEHIGTEGSGGPVHPPEEGTIGPNIQSGPALLHAAMRVGGEGDECGSVNRGWRGILELPVGQERKSQAGRILIETRPVLKVGPALNAIIFHSSI